MLRFSPRVWGWSDSDRDSVAEIAVFPTGVGMVRECRYTLRQIRSFPHGCGDGPLQSEYERYLGVHRRGNT